MLYTVINFENICSDLGLNKEFLDLQSNAVPSELSKHAVATSMNIYYSDMIIIGLLKCKT